MPLVQDLRFSVAYALMLKSLPVRDSSPLVFVFSSQKQIDLPKASSTDTEYPEWRKQGTVFDTMGAHKDDNLNLTSDGDPERLAASAEGLEGRPVDRATLRIGILF